jgi:hypothetical protein
VRPDPAACGRRLPESADRALFDAIVQCTRSIVEAAGRSHWDGVRTLAVERGALFGRLRRGVVLERHAACIDALDGALRESDAFLAELDRSR